MPQLSTFQRVAVEEPAVVNQVLFAAVGALVDLQTTRPLKAELTRRVERN